MTLKRIIVAAAAASVLTATAAFADVAALGSTATGGTSQIGRALAAAISENSDIRMQPQELANTADYMPLVNAGELDFGISNIVQLYHGVTGTGMSEGRPLPNLQMVATLMPFRHAYVVRRDSDIMSVRDLVGKRVPVFAEGALGDYVTKAYFATEGMTTDQTTGVQVPNFPRMWAAFSEGTTDVTIVVVGAANSREFDAAFGIRYLSFEDSEEALAAQREWLPQSYQETLDASADLPGLTETTNIMVFDYVLWASADASEDLVYRATKALHDATEGLLATGGPVWDGFSQEVMSKDVNVEYHPGAVRFYEEVGLWNR